MIIFKLYIFSFTLVVNLSRQSTILSKINNITTKETYTANFLLVKRRNHQQICLFSLKLIIPNNETRTGANTVIKTEYNIYKHILDPRRGGKLKWFHTKQEDRCHL